MADGGALVLPGVAGKSTAQLLDLGYGGLMPGTEALHREGKEHDEFLEKFRKGGGSFSIQKFILQILDL